MRPFHNIGVTTRGLYRRLTGLPLALLTLMLSQAIWAQSTVLPATITQAPETGSAWNSAPLDLANHGLTETEYFFEGQTSAGTYRSRMLVRRPINPHKFNGTVIVEWMNASSGLDIDVDFIPLLPLIERMGYAYVAVTAQAGPVSFLKGYDADRYGSLVLTSDAMANEVFSQAGKSLLAGGVGIDPLAGLKVKRLIAIGQSQSSGRLTDYVSNVHGLTLEPVFDAFLPHAGGDAPTRFPAPVFKLNSESEAPAYFGSRATNDPNYIYWEIPGTAHQPLEGNDYAIQLLLAGRGSAYDCPFPYQGPGGPVATGPVLRAAVHYLNRWIRTGKRPPEAPLIDMLPDTQRAGFGQIQRDQYGNALGGIRMPQQEVPTGRNSPSYGCVVNVPFPPFTITLDLLPQYDAFDGNNDPGVDPTDTYYEPSGINELYRSHGHYVSHFAVATVRVYRQGYILYFDAHRMIREAAKSDIARRAH